MKKSVAIFLIAAFAASCNSHSTNSNENSNPIVSSDSGVSSRSADSSTANMKSIVKEGTMGMKNGKMQVMQNDTWVPMEKEYTCTDGCKVMPDGHVIMKNGDKVMLKEGEMIEQSGAMLNAQGNMEMNPQNNMTDSTKR